jgi:hypothetical protein
MNPKGNFRPACVPMANVHFALYQRWLRGLCPAENSTALSFSSPTEMIEFLQKKSLSEGLRRCCSQSKNNESNR